MERTDALTAIRLLTDSHNRREIELSRQSCARTVDEDHDADGEASIFDSFYLADGNEGILKMTNLSACKFQRLYGELRLFIIANWNTGRGRKRANKPMDVLVMTLALLKHGSSWNFLAKMFRMKGPTFERLVIGFLQVILPEVKRRFIEPVADMYTMCALQEDKKDFKDFSFAIEAIDVAFQQSNRPSGNMQEGKVYFSGKHKLYGYKMEVAVRPNGLASWCSKHYPGSVSDIGILTEGIQDHLRRVRKSTEGKEL